MTPSQLKRWRDAIGLTLDEASDLFGVSRRLYAAWEAGGDGRPNRPRYDEIPQLAELAWCELNRRLKKIVAGRRKTVDTVRDAH